MEPLVALDAEDVRRLVRALETVHDHSSVDCSPGSNDDTCDCMEVVHRVVDEFRNQTGVDL